MKKIIVLLMLLVFLLGCTEQNEKKYLDINDIVDSNFFVDQKPIDSNDSNTIIIDSNIIITPDINYSKMSELEVSTPKVDYPLEDYEYTPSDPI